MKISTEQIRDGGLTGETVWVCDFRQPDLNKKAIRHVKPTKVIVKSNNDLPKNKTVYYSENHFSPINDKGKITSKIISPVDNTGFRSRSGVELNVFDNEIECKAYYKCQCQDIIDRYQKMITSAVDNLKDRQLEIIKHKNAI